MFQFPTHIKKKIPSHRCPTTVNTPKAKARGGFFQFSAHFNIIPGTWTTWSQQKEMKNFSSASKNVNISEGKKFLYIGFALHLYSQGYSDASLSIWHSVHCTANKIRRFGKYIWWEYHLAIFLQTKTLSDSLSFTWKNFWNTQNSLQTDNASLSNFTQYLLNKEKEILLTM